MGVFVQTGVENAEAIFKSHSFYIYRQIFEVILGVLAQKSENVLVTYCSLRLHVFPLKIRDFC